MSQVHTIAPPSSIIYNWSHAFSHAPPSLMPLPMGNNLEPLHLVFPCFSLVKNLKSCLVGLSLFRGWYAPCLDLFLLSGKEVLLQRNAELLAERLEFLEVLIVLALGVDLGLDACVIR